MSKKTSLFTIRQLVGIVTLLLMIAATYLFVALVPQPQPAPSLSTQDSVWADSISHHTYRRYTRDTIEIRLQEFDPNTADSLTLLHLGLRPWQVRNLMRYRAKGGHYRTKEDFHRLYGLDSLYYVLEPYIVITPAAADSTTSEVPNTRSTKRDTLLTLNATDTTELQYLRGVGPSVARHIIRYGEMLGGYYSPEQIREIAALIEYDRDSTYHFSLDSVVAHLSAAPDSIRPLLVNRVGIRTLSAHPYIRYEQAESLYQLRRKRKLLHSIDDLRTLPCFSEQDLQRLRPYLDFTTGRD